LAERAYLSIGDVLSLLREEFPDVTISKIRFLESQGLLDPERTPSGYRKFYDEDVARLRWILRQQRENFLPLKVIRDRLDADRSEEAATQAEHEGTLPTGHVAHEAEHASGQPAAHLPSPGPPHAPAMASAPASAGGDKLAAATGMSGPAVAEERGGAQEATPRGEPRGPGAPPSDGDPRGQSLWRSSASAPAEVATRPPGSTGPGRSGEAGPPSTGAGDEGRPVSQGAGRPADGRPPAAQGPSGERQGGDGRPGARREGRPAGVPSSLAGGPTSVSLTLEELAGASGLPAEALRELERYGLIGGRPVAGTVYYDHEALTVARLAGGFGRLGIEPRHLRMYKTAADREAGFFEQIVMPMLRQRNPAARQRAIDTQAELTRLGHDLRASLLRISLREQTGI
jgi:DNA-binding transcriptional MerR regulator